MGNYPWYDTVSCDEPLKQGDIINACPVVIPCKTIVSQEKIQVKVEEYDVIILSQSCDLKHRKLNLVLVCPFWSLSEFGERNSYYKGKEGKKGLLRGYTPGYHLLRKCEIEGFETDFLVVDFRNVYGVPFESLQSLAKERGKRLRLLPPYREHLSQGFARFFMRVGLPVDIPESELLGTINHT